MKLSRVFSLRAAALAQQTGVRFIRSPTARDVLCISLAVAASWIVIERTGASEHIIDLMTHHADHRGDPYILAFMLAAAGIALFAVLRLREARSEMLARRAAEERAHSLAFRDPLTDLPNRRALAEHLDTLMARSDGARVGLLISDLDRFKTINDVHGHLAGDRLLMAVAEQLANLTDEGGRVYRLGGDEFAFVLDLASGTRSAATDVAERVVEAMAKPLQVGGLTHHVGASVGISIFPDDASDRQELMRCADIALYRAKDGGRGRLLSFEPRMDAEIVRRAEIEAELRQALKNEEFRPAFQPLVDLRTGETVGFELLARWPRADGTEIGPSEFIPVAEESGLITELMLQTLAFACAEARDWNPSLTIAINVSPIQLSDPHLCQKILATLTRFGFAPRRLAVEITENALIMDYDKAKCAIESLTNVGIKVGLDDFGTGYASLQHLRLLPFDKIKIDRSFVLALDHDPEALKIVRAIIGLALSLDLPIIAEGIENEGVAAQLRDLGCTQGQGFHLGYPVSGAQVSRVLGGPTPICWDRTGLRRSKPVLAAAAA